VAAGKPVIGINLEASGDAAHPRLSLGSDYVDAVTSAGGLPILLPPALSIDDCRRYARMCDGFVFTGGKDIAPVRYGQPQRAQMNLLLERRENFDFALIKEVMRLRKPLLGVCLGCQELNVALGGTLVQDIPTQTSSTIEHHNGAEAAHQLVHEIAITTSSKLADIVGTTTLAVNSNHHQSCDQPGRGIRYTAVSPDGVIESYELTNYPFGLAVQWHPEAVAVYPEHLRIYKALVRSAGRKNDKPVRQVQKVE
jgi:putative glutamine amidotransferase